MARQHDADLCDRIRQLEEKVAELEARPQYPVYPYWWQGVLPPYHYCYLGCPIHSPITIRWGNGSTFDTTSTVTYNSDTAPQSTLT